MLFFVYSNWYLCNNHLNNYGFNSIQIINIVPKIEIPTLNLMKNGKLNKHFDLIGRFNDHMVEKNLNI